MGPVTLLKTAAGAALLSLVLGESLSYSRVHIVDHDEPSGNFLYRGNMPTLTNSTTGQEYFALETLLSYMQQRAVAANLTFPDWQNGGKFFLDIHSFNNVFEEKDWQYEQAWAKSNPDLGSFTLWPLVGQLLPPQDVNQTEFERLVHNDTALWGVDQLPTRVPALRSLLLTKGAVPRIIYFHCEAGCDRTGEMASSYYMQEVGLSANASYARSTAECGRAPDYWSTNAIEWYCATLTAQNIASPGNCTV